MEEKQLFNHWNYFLLLEKDFIVLKNYIEVSEENFKIYSFELSKILQLACSEIDSICRLICKTIDSENDYFNEDVYSGNIAQYKKIILAKYPKMTETEVRIPELKEILLPWDEWNVLDSPKWWKEYNLVKHYRHSNFKKANLENVISALSALLILNLYLYRIHNKSFLNLHPQYFNTEYVYEFIVCDKTELPDFS